MKVKIIFIILILFLILDASPAFAFPAKYYGRAAAEFNIPESILLSVSYVESGFTPYALDINGYPVMSANFRYSYAVAVYFLQRNYSVDLGLMQINYNIWGKRLGFGIKELLNPAYNIMAGAYILRHYYNKTGSIWKAVGMYHSNEPAAAASYERKVYAVYSYIKG